MFTMFGNSLIIQIFETIETIYIFTTRPILRNDQKKKLTIKITKENFN